MDAYQIQTAAATERDTEGGNASSSNGRNVPFLFGTIKGYAGHAEAGAGAVGVLEAVSVMQQQALPPALHVRELNPYIAQPLEGRAVLINRSTGLAPAPAWQEQQKGSAAVGVSSFGAQVRARAWT